MGSSKDIVSGGSKVPQTYLAVVMDGDIPSNDPYSLLHILYLLACINLIISGSQEHVLPSICLVFD